MALFRFNLPIAQRPLSSVLVYPKVKHGRRRLTQNPDPRFLNKAQWDVPVDTIQAKDERGMVFVFRAFFDEMLTPMLNAQVHKGRNQELLYIERQNIAVSPKNFWEAPWRCFHRRQQDDGLPCLWYNQTTRINVTSYALGRFAIGLPIPALKLH